jgi:hypothetical protein
LTGGNLEIEGKNGHQEHSVTDSEEPSLDKLMLGGVVSGCPVLLLLVILY